MHTSTNDNSTAPLSVRCAPGEVRLRMPATRASIDSADAELMRWLERWEVAVDRFAVRILLREALLNAVIHGSGECAQQEVRCTIQNDAESVTLIVEDDGPGFLWQDRDLTFQICGDGGRGLALMQTYASEVIFNDRGNRVVLRRRVETPQTATPN